MIVYLQNGIRQEDLNHDEENTTFMISEYVQGGNKEYFYPECSIRYDIDAALVELYDIFTDLLFSDTEEYYAEEYMMPIWVQEAGQSSDCSISAELFAEFVAQGGHKNLEKHLYLVDCQYLVGTIQNLLTALDDAFIRYYRIISEEKKIESDGRQLTEKDGTIFIMSEEATRASETIETYFTKAYSILDILTKICYEIEHLQTDFSKYGKTRSANILWGDRKKLKINGTPNTLFETTEMTNCIETIRNEVVHNGTWELHPKIFVRYEDYVIRERFMLFPDLNDGRLCSIKSRRHFFSEGKKINEILPQIHNEYKKRLLNTVKTIFAIYK